MADFSRYLIATDLDGTFLTKSSGIPERNLRALERYRAGGGLFTFATGRTYTNVRPLLPNVENLLNTAAVLCNGACLYDFAERRALFETMMPEAEVTRLLEFAAVEAPDLLFYVLARRQIRFSNFTDETNRYVAFCEPGAVLISNPNAWPRGDWYKMVFRGTSDRLPAVRKMLTDRFGDRFALTSSSNHNLEIQMAGCSKAVGLAKLREIDERARDRVLIVCGDYENDIPMLTAADIAVCPENASPAVKEIADYVLCSCTEGMIGDLVEKLESGAIRKSRKEAVTV